MVRCLIRFIATHNIDWLVDLFYEKNGGGGAGGAGSQIFSIGKSKAKLFDQKSGY